MATRNLTEVFVLMRNNALRNKNTFSDHNDSTERMHLIALNDGSNGTDIQEILMPPPWTDQLEEAQYTLTRLKNKIDELKTLHLRHLHRPTFDETSEDEKVIELCTADITVMFNTVHRQIQYIKSHCLDGTLKEKRLTTNVVQSLASNLQDLSVQFRSTQNNFLNQIQSREERSKLYFDNPSLNDHQYMFDNSEDNNIDDYFVNSRMTQQQLLFLEEESTRIVEQREQEVNAIVKSIIDLNDIFKDLSQMVANQGTILDRIDYNIEQTQTQVYQGFKQLQKADAYHRKNRKMWAIIILAITVIVLFFILIAVKT